MRSDGLARSSDADHRVRRRVLLRLQFGASSSWEGSLEGCIHAELELGDGYITLPTTLQHHNAQFPLPPRDNTFTQILTLIATWTTSASRALSHPNEDVQTERERGKKFNRVGKNKQE